MDILQQLNQIAQERDIPVKELTQELEDALGAAYKKYIDAPGEVVVQLDPKRGWTALIQKEVVGEVMEPSIQISLIEAKKRNPNIEVGDFLGVEVDPNRFGRIAAQTFKQVLNQKLRDAEYRRIQEVFSDKTGQVVTGTVLRREENTVFVQVDRVEAELPQREQIPYENLRANDNIRVYVIRVEEERRGLKVVVSRTHPLLLKGLLSLEVPEIGEGIVVIKSIAREPGQRAKVSVLSTDERVDALGSCVGQRGARVQDIMEELKDERIDIVPYSGNPEKYLANALSPAKVNSIKLNEDEKSAFVVVPDSQLSLAIGKGGQNVRLAAKLTDWKIDICSESQLKDRK